MQENGQKFKDKEGTNWVGLSFKRGKEDKRTLIMTYLNLLSAFNTLKLSDFEVNLLSHIILNKGVLSGTCKLNFVEKYETTIPAINNTVSKLKKKKLLIKKENIVTIQPKINLDFLNNNNFIFSFKCIVL